MAKHYKHDRPFLNLRGDVLEVRQATEAGYIECPSGGLFDASYPNSTLRRARVVGGGKLAPALMAGASELYIFIVYDL